MTLLERIKRDWALLKHDVRLLRDSDWPKDMNRAEANIKSHLAINCPRCEQLFGHIYRKDESCQK